MENIESYSGKVKKLIDLRKQYKTLPYSQESEKGKILLKEIIALDKELKEIDSSFDHLIK